MTTPKILNVGVYRHAQKSSQIVSSLFLSLRVKGLIKSTHYYPDGTLFRSFNATNNDQQALLSLTPAGSKVFFEYGRDRENWVIMLDFPSIYYDSNKRHLFWDYNGNQLSIPSAISLTPNKPARYPA